MTLREARQLLLGIIEQINNTSDIAKRQKLEQSFEQLSAQIWNAEEELTVAGLPLDRDPE